MIIGVIELVARRKAITLRVGVAGSRMDAASRTQLHFHRLTHASAGDLLNESKSAAELRPVLLLRVRMSTAIDRLEVVSIAVYIEYMQQIQPSMYT